MVITTTQFDLTKSELRFCTGSNPAHGMSEIRDGEDLWQWSRLEIRLNVFHRSTILQKQFIINSSGRIEFYLVRQDEISDQTIFYIKKKTKKTQTLWPLFYGWGSTVSRLEPLQGGSLLFTTKFPEIFQKIVRIS